MESGKYKSKATGGKSSQYGASGSRKPGTKVLKSNQSSKNNGGKSANFRSRGRKVEILDSKVIEGGVGPAVTIQNELCKVNAQERILNAVGIRHLPSSQDKIPVATSIPCISNSGALNEPAFQSSLSLMKNLEDLKVANFDVHRLMQLKLTDKNLQKGIEKKAASVVNVRPSDSVYKQLQSLSVNTETFISHQEWKHHNMAEKYAPKKCNKDPDLQLNDFIHPQWKHEEPFPTSIAPSFAAECQQWGSELFSPHSICRTNHLSAYEMFI